MSTKGTREHDLWLGRSALARGLITGRQLTESLLMQSKTGLKKPLDLVLIDQNLLTRGQVQSIKEDLSHGRTIRQEIPTDTDADSRLTQIVLKVLLDRIESQERFITTYVGRLPRDPLPVALQLIDKAALRNGLWMDFLETVRACKGVRVRNLVEVIDVDRTDTHFGVILRYQKGGLLLRGLLNRLRRLKLSEALRITRELAQGLAALHAAGIVHRDVKTENVLLGQKGEVQLRNAGIVFEPAGAVKFAPARSVFGTPHSIPPECVRGEQPDTNSDIYSLGILAYELVTGVKPFEGETLAHLGPQHLNEQPIPPHKIMKALPKDVGELLIWMLSKRGPDRPSAPKLISTLQSLEKSIKRTGMTTKFQAFDPDE